MRLIDADMINPSTIFVIGNMSQFDFDNAVRSLIYNQPTVDAVPVVHGRWEHRKNGIAFCSECECDAVEDDTNFCPNCGA